MVTQKDIRLISDLFKGVYSLLDITVMELKETIHVFINTPYVIIYNPFNLVPMYKFLGTDVTFEDAFEIYEKLDSFVPHISNKIVIIGKTNTHPQRYYNNNEDNVIFENKIFTRDNGTMDYNPNIC